MMEKDITDRIFDILDVGFRHSFEDRFNFVLAVVGGVGKAAELCGVNRGTIPKWSKSDGKMPINAALTLCNAARVTLDWLATGHHVRPQAEVPGADRASSPEEALDLVRIPLLGVSAAAGAGAANDGTEVEDHIFMSRAQLRALGVSTEMVHFIRVRGDSMEPTIADGAIVLIDAARRRFRGDGIYAITVGGDVRLKRLATKADGAVLAISDNPRYPQELLSAADLEGAQIEGRVVWTEQRL